MDLERFNAITGFVYGKYEEEPAFTLAEVLNVFKCYFRAYEQHTGRPHPPISARNIKVLIDNMAWCEDPVFDGVIDLFSEAYEELIEQYFKTEYKTDRNINHFFSGTIRGYKYYEVLF